MRTLDIGFKAHVESGATTLCNCWRIVRVDGVVLGFTDHDQTLVFDGTQFLPAHGLDGGEVAQKLGPQTDTSEVVGVLHSDAIAEEDILLGRYDGAMVETWRANWRDTAQRHLMRRSTIGEIVREDGLFRAELRSAQHALNQPRGRLYQALCDASVGDARCGVDLDVPAFTAAVSIAEVRDRYRLAVSGAGAFDEGWFGFGRAVWTSGRRIGITDQIVSHARNGGVDVFGFAAPVGDWVEAGDTLAAAAGCDRRFATCGEKFANSLKFRGFPHIPGNDFVLRYPRPASQYPSPAPAPRAPRARHRGESVLGGMAKWSSMLVYPPAVILALVARTQPRDVCRAREWSLAPPTRRRWVLATGARMTAGGEDDDGERE